MVLTLLLGVGSWQLEVARGQQPAPQQPSEVAVVISGDPGTPPRYAVPDFIAASPDAAEAAKTITQVLWDDLAFEREFYLIPRDKPRQLQTHRSDSDRHSNSDNVARGHQSPRTKESIFHHLEYSNRI